MMVFVTMYVEMISIQYKKIYIKKCKNRKNYVKNSKCNNEFGNKLPCRSYQRPKICNSINGKNSKSLFTYNQPRKDKKLVIGSKNFTGEVPNIIPIPE